MPIYEYHCENCDQTFECLVIGSAKPECTACNSKKVRKLMSACGFVSKGGGQTVRQAAGSSCGSCHASSCGGCKH
ncbi:MAG: zinc ribbon domain-containing protein [Deltaproteobacteria bacterium]|nr:zinc ribbon domain-containing protein [Deltaproteobacteria bacterium]